MHDLERLTLADEIRRLMARYVRYADHQRWQDLANLFTPTGTFTPHKPDGSVWLHMSGRKEIAATIGGTAGPGDVYIHHLFSDEINVESANSARGIFAMADKIFRADRDAEQTASVPADFAFTRMAGYGHYHAEFVKADGAWFIAELVQTRLRLDFAH
ncbi:MAG TPA: nuclear transport factor 2 family protein [Pseudonocardiaceae bacterium]|jgi:hypothetical protein